MDPSQIIAQLPYSQPFLFVDAVDRIDENGVEGHYTFRPEADFYRGHFKDRPITPGVILTECMAQIGLVCLGIHLIRGGSANNPTVALSHSEVDFLTPVLPGETVRVVSEKEYFRFNKLKCRVKMYNQSNVLVCKGVLSGMLIEQKL